MARRLDFRSTFLSTCQLLIFPQYVSAKNIHHHLYLPANGMLLNMLSLNFLNKVAKWLNFHSTKVLLLNLFDKDQNSLNKVTKQLDFLLDLLLSKRSSKK